MKIPANIISEGLYTIGNEFVYANSYKEYQGYYYTISDRFFAGREFNTKAPRLLKLNSNEINILKLNLNPSISTYINLKEIKSSLKIPSIPLELTNGTKYLAKQINSNPIKIIFTNEETFKNANQYPEYNFVSIEFEIEFGFIITEEIKKYIPEIDIFLSEFSMVGEEDEI